MNSIQVFAGNASMALADAICAHLGATRGRAEIRRFSDGEIFVEINDNVRGADVFVVQSTSSPGNDHLMELLLMLDALKRASAGRVTAVVPYYGYARQDRKVSPRVPISAKLVADLIVTAGASRVMTMELHAGQIQGFFNVPVDNLYSNPVLLPYISEAVTGMPLAVVSPDAGGVERARAYAKRLEATLAIIDKRRVRANQVEEMRIIGDVTGCAAVIIDDMIDTAGTVCAAATAIIEAGAKRVLACTTHGVLSGPAVDRISASRLDTVITTDTIAPTAAVLANPKIRIVSVAPFMAEAIRRTHQEESISSLFE
ncbi:MAG TPA: ribose-phosphate pyrophosphokinase [Candidatus Limnocylindrales bacterium]|nr:ribose-phosphate pyrophosphokinase [Candidatus Limnocylindrales bacterium]